MNNRYNRAKYIFDDFTFDNYRRLIQKAKVKYKFCGYDIDFELEDNFVLWRHDLEFSVPIACSLARIENEEGVKSTFFVQLHSEFYNTLDKRTVKKINSIIELGHDIGLHFDSHFYNIKNIEELEHYLHKDVRLLEDIFATKIKTFSFHNTNSFILNCEEEYYAGLLNVYSKKIKETISYCSDSLGYWRYDRLEDRLDDNHITKLQVLTHDALWNKYSLSPRQRLRESIQKDADELKSFYDDYLKEHGHLNIDEEFSI